MNRMASSWVLALFLFGCGDDEGGGGEGESHESCGIGVTLSGDLQESVSVSDNAACLVSFSYESGIDAGLTTLSAGFAILISIDAVTEGQTGAGFPTEIGVSIDDGPSYSTSPGGCSATITEHELVGTETTDIGEVRDYRVAGTAACTAPALRDDGMVGQITLSDVAFYIPAVWSD